MRLNIAVIGAGGFAQFATTQFVSIEGVKLTGIFDENVSHAMELRKIDASAKIYHSLQELLQDPAIELVYIATPPYLHYEQSKMALLAGKHVICEKPASIELEHARELRDLGESKGLLFVVNLMQRYNLLYDAVGELIEKKVLGDFLHGYFENYASDEFLPEQHWFWNVRKSGGIFIEHGVHFFDMFSGWLGEGRIIAAQKSNRQNVKEVWDKAQATVLFAGGLVNFYHAFDQPKIMDRQEMRLQFEKGEITLFEWVPTRLTMTALCDEQDLQTLKTMFPAAEINILESHKTSVTSLGRFKEIKYHYKIRLDTGEALQKQTLYQELVTKMFRDQLAWIENHTHQRKIDQNNAVNSLKLAVDAERMAVRI